MERSVIREMSPRITLRSMRATREFSLGGVGGHDCWPRHRSLVLRGRSLRGGRGVAVGRRRRALLLLDEGELLARRLGLALAIPHAGIEAALRQQLRVSAALDDDAVI